MITQKTLQKVRRDLELVSHLSRYLITITDPDGVEIKIADSSGPRLALMTIIGRPQKLAPDFIKVSKRYGVAIPKVVDLCEIGIGATRANHPNNMQGPEGKVWVPSRKKVSWLTPDQYRLVRPHILAMLQYEADIQAENWARPGLDIEQSRFQVTARSKGRVIESWPKRYPIYSGKRFSVLKEDPLLLADILRGELKNPILNYQLHKFFLFSDKVYGMNRGSKFSDPLRYINLRKLAESVARYSYLRLENGRVDIARHLLAYMIRKFVEEDSQKWSDFCRIFDCDPKADPILALAATALPGAEERIAGLAIRVKKIHPDHVVFEVLGERVKSFLRKFYPIQLTI
ncbi:MAG: hypothetical protein COV31_01135 [Candidatus Yanofskybacteria bacterium CG10_big_fil_rev_8_21_14_0_10_46_23]|uniref:Uncharacterized protein n=1 Tax=Candidatus Yanofskybacteria bacterium CG10_big_fil_rev_8_21_14_0_10_46_23 TaxID=1975098 RepID=A0A2H0R4K9_9BACT|nr:MAG: hypothetical protein COV31_01135 [Candidatus Yanofskybacteria bacterium CG10_big_fil_rev_8_21_14_0_10_46_23]